MLKYISNEEAQYYEKYMFTVIHFKKLTFSIFTDTGFPIPYFATRIGNTDLAHILSFHRYWKDLKSLNTHFL